MRMAMLKKIFKGFLVVLLGLVLLLWAFKSYSDRHYFDNYDPGAPLNIAVLGTTGVNEDSPDKGHTITKFTFDGYQGEKVPTLLAMPLKRSGKRLPIVIFLHGIGQNKNFLKEITAPFNQAGFGFVCFDQYMQGERRLTGKLSFLARYRAFAQRAAKTVNETRRLIDYLSAHPEVDSQRIYLVRRQLRRGYGQHRYGQGQAPASRGAGVRRRRLPQTAGLLCQSPRRGGGLGPD